MNSIEKTVLRKLYTRKVIGKHHIRLATLLKCGWKPHERGLVKDAVESLLKQKLIIWAKRSKEALKLNKEYMAAIEQVVKS